MSASRNVEIVRGGASTATPTDTAIGPWLAKVYTSGVVSDCQVVASIADGRRIAMTNMAAASATAPPPENAHA